MMREHTLHILERRMLAAIRPLDPLGRRVTGPVEASAAGARFLSKPDGTLILTRWDELPDFDSAFETQPAGPSKSIMVDLKPANAAFMPRRLTLDLPRDSDPANAAQPDSVFTAVSARMPASMAMQVPGQALALAARIVRDSDNAPIAGAVLKLVPSGKPDLSAVGVTNRHGEALLPIAGLPLSRLAGGGQLSQEHDAAIELFVDPAAIRFDRREAKPLDPDALIAGGNPALSRAVTLSSQTTTSAELRWSPP